MKSQELGVWGTVDYGHKNLNDKRLAPVTHDYRVEDCHWVVSVVTVRVGHWPYFNMILCEGTLSADI